jgi:hypothetical protein
LEEQLDDVVTVARRVFGVAGAGLLFRPSLTANRDPGPTPTLIELELSRPWLPSVYASRSRRTKKIGSSSRLQQSWGIVGPAAEQS